MEAVQFNSQYYSDLASVKSEKELLKQHLVSKLELVVADKLRAEGVWVALNFRLLTPDEDNPDNLTDRYVDMYLPKKDLAVEIDGEIYHNGKDRAQRDARKNRAINNTGIFRILRLPFSLPDELIYGKIRDKWKRENVKHKYEKYQQDWIENAISEILEYSDIEGKLTHSPIL